MDSSRGVSWRESQHIACMKAVEVGPTGIDPVQIVQIRCEA